jgi:glutamate-1-semialdehyde 2,1-aminomutase
MQRCRGLCTEYGALLAFDEVMTGCHVALGSAKVVL